MPPIASRSASWCWRCCTHAGDEATWDGATGAELERLLDVPRVLIFDSTTSTLDIAHEEAAAGARAGTIVIANEQTAGRGRGGNSWSSPAGAGIWMTLLERPADTSGLEVLSLRVGMAAARSLDAFAEEPVRLKWPNDIYLDDRKLAGTLVEARWRDQTLEYVAIGFGVNVEQPPEKSGRAGLDHGTRRLDVLGGLVAGMREAAAATGPLSADEIEEFAARDIARGRHCTVPALGRVAGISARGELLVALADTVARFRSGSLVFGEEQ